MKFSILLLFLVLALLSCNSYEKQYQLVEEISYKALRKSNRALSKLSSSNYESINNKLRDNMYGERVVFWDKKARKLEALTINILQDLNSVDIKSKTAIDTLYLLKCKYIHEVILIDSNLQKTFNPEIDSFLIKNDKPISSSFYAEITKNDILILESKFSTEFSDQLHIVFEAFSQFRAIASQNTEHLKSGEELEIIAGIGYFITASNPTFIINGKTILPNQQGVAIYKLKVRGKGKNSIPVKIIYTGQKGVKEEFSTTKDYFIDK
jgi:hypothetical protein